MAEDMGKAQEEQEIRLAEGQSEEGRTKEPIAARKSLAQRLQSEETFPVTVAVLVGAVAAFIIMVAGLHAERQAAVIIERAMIGFLVSGLVMFFACRWLNDRGIPLYVRCHEEMQHSWVSEPEAERVEKAQAILEEKDEERETASLTDNAFAPLEDGFSPLGSSLPHVEVPKG